MRTIISFFNYIVPNFLCIQAISSPLHRFFFFFSLSLLNSFHPSFLGRYCVNFSPYHKCLHFINIGLLPTHNSQTTSSKTCEVKQQSIYVYTVIYTWQCKIPTEKYLPKASMKLLDLRINLRFIIHIHCSTQNNVFIIICYDSLLWLSIVKIPWPVARQYFPTHTLPTPLHSIPRPDTCTALKSKTLALEIMIFSIHSFA